MISNTLQYFIKSHGPVQNQQLVDPTAAESYRDRLPSSLLDFWIEQGWGSYAGGMLKVCDPSLFQGVLQLVLENDKDFHPNQCCAFAFTAFGELFVWHQRYWVLTINLLRYQVSALRFFKEEKKTKPDIEVSSPLIAFKKDRYDVRDSSNKPLYDRAVKAYGVPDLDECFGFFPALPLGGVRTLESLKRVKAREHFAMLAQMSDFQLMDFDTFPGKVVRKLA